MKKIYSLLAALLLVGSLAAQGPGRTSKTIAADVLAQMPAAQQADYNKQIGDLASAGEEAVLLIVDMVNAPGKGDNSQVDYALQGLSSYVAAKGEERSRAIVAGAYIKALDKVTERETKALLIRQLQICGGDDAVDALGRYLGQPELSGPAARALATIHTDKAKQALQSALLRKMGTAKTQADVVDAIGQARMAVPEDLVLGLYAGGDAALQKAVMFAIGRIGTKASLNFVGAAATGTGYMMENTGANEAYIALIKNVAAQGDAKEAEKAAADLLKKATKAGKTHTRVAALQILFSLSDNPTKLLMTAMKDNCIEYRNAALTYASDYADKAMYVEVMKSISKAKAPQKIDLLNWIGRESKCPEKHAGIRDLEIKFDLSGKQVLLAQLKDKDTQVIAAAAGALMKIGDATVIPSLAELLTNANPEVVAIGESALTSFKGDVSPAVAKAFASAQDAGKVAALRILATRKADATMNTVMDQIKNGSPEVQKAAYIALKDVVGEKDFTVLCGMLESATGETISPLQSAIVSAISRQDAATQYANVSKRMIAAGESKKHLYFPVLSATGDKAALPVLVEGFKTGRGDAKDMAFEAIYNWTGAGTADELYAVCLDPAAEKYFDRALDAYIRLVGGNDVTAENRTIFLRKAMEIAKTDRQKVNIMRRIERTGTFQAMMYAGQFLGAGAVQQAAVNTVMNIALANPDFNGELVRGLLQKVIEVIDNPDASYQKEAVRKHLAEMPKGEGFMSMFNGKDLTGWKGLVENPIKRAAMKPADLEKAQVKADEVMRRDWFVENGCLVFDGPSYDNLCTVREYGDVEMYVDWLLDPSGKEADAGIYLRGTPQVQMWDTARVRAGAQVGSGGLYNNRVHESKPLMVADNKLGEWNSMYIRMVGDRVTVILNGHLVTDNVILENFWDRKLPIFPVEQIELQAHGSKVFYRNLYIKELERAEPFKLSADEVKEGYKILFDGTNMHEWVGNTADYLMDNEGNLSLEPGHGSGGNLYTKDEYGNFIFRFEFQLTPAANNGLGIRTPREGDAAYSGMELQILDNDHQVYKDLEEYQYHGSVYGVIAAKRGALKPVGEWNYQEVIANGNKIKITLNGEVILDGDIKDASKNGTVDKKEHPGLLNKKGHIAFLGHGSPVKFRNIRIKELK